MKRNNLIYFGALGLTIALTIVAFIVYELDYKADGNTTNSIANIIKNEGKTDFFYKINDEFAFMVIGADLEDDTYIGIGPYYANYFPFCMICGWYTSNLNDSRVIHTPYLLNDIVFSSQPLTSEAGVAPKGSFTTLHLKTGEYAFVNNLTALGINEHQPGKAITHDYIRKNFEELSFEGPDDEDCMITFGALAILYVILSMWGTVVMFRLYLNSQADTPEPEA